MSVRGFRGLALCVAALMSTSAAAERAKLAVVETSTSADGISAEKCVVLDPAAARLEAQGMRVVRRARVPGESVASFRTRFSANIAIVAGAGQLLTAGEVSDLAVPRTSTASVEEACRGNVSNALDRGGALVDPGVLAVVRGDDNANRGPLLARLAKALARHRTGKDARAQLGEVLESLERGETAPTWKIVPPMNPTAVAWVRGSTRGLLFGSDAAFSLDLNTGRTGAGLAVGPSLPDAVYEANAPIVIAGRGLSALDAKDFRPLWRVPLDSSWPEVVVTSTAVFAAGDTHAIAIDRASGRVTWKRDLLADLAAGPATLHGALLFPAEARVAWLDGATGEIRAELAVGDELASPFHASQDALWALVGGERVARIQHVGGELQTAIIARGLLGASWPPVATGSSLWLGVKEKHRGQGLARIDVGSFQGTPLVPKLEAGRAPLVAIPDGLIHVGPSGDAVVARDSAGAERWRTAVGGPVSQLLTTETTIVVVSDARLVWIELTTGKRISELRFEAGIANVVAHDHGGVVILANGLVYGIAGRDDARTRRWIRDTRMVLAQTNLARGDRRKAKSFAESVLELAPEDPEALFLLAQLAGKKDAQLWFTRLLAAVSASDPLAAIARDRLSH